MGPNSRERRSERLCGHVWVRVKPAGAVGGTNGMERLESRRPPERRARRRAVGGLPARAARDAWFWPLCPCWLARFFSSSAGPSRGREVAGGLYI